MASVEDLWSGGRFLKGVQSFYDESRAGVRGESGMSEWFDANVGLRQGYVISPWLFNVYIDGVFREVNARVQGRGLMPLRGQRLESEIIIVCR